MRETRLQMKVGPSTDGQTEAPWKVGERPRRGATLRERLHESLRESIEQMKRGETIDAAEALTQLRAHQ